MEKITLSKKDRLSVAWRHQFLQGSWNYERMQNGGWCYSIIPAIKKLYPNTDDPIAALKRHMEFYNTHPYVSAPVMGCLLYTSVKLTEEGDYVQNRIGWKSKLWKDNDVQCTDAQ